jgi:hypothetical protein
VKRISFFENFVPQIPEKYCRQPPGNEFSMTRTHGRPTYFSPCIIRHETSMRQGFAQFSLGLLKLISLGLLKLMAKNQQAASELAQQKENPK